MQSVEAPVVLYQVIAGQNSIRRILPAAGA